MATLRGTTDDLVFSSIRFLKEVLLMIYMLGIMISMRYNPRLSMSSPAPPCDICLDNYGKHRTWCPRPAWHQACSALSAQGSPDPYYAEQIRLCKYTTLCFFEILNHLKDALGNKKLYVRLQNLSLRRKILAWCREHVDEYEAYSFFREDTLPWFILNLKDEI